jgi:ribokinase
MHKIVVFGSINTDLVIKSPYIPENGETLKGSEFYISHGGKGANQAVAASVLGGDVQMIGCLGNDSFGKEALVALKNYHVGTTYVKVLDNVYSSVAVIIHVDNDNRIILGSGSNDYLTANDLEFFFQKHNTEKGIFITQLENNHNEVFKALKMAKENKMITIFNPTPARILPKEVYKNVDILIVNQSESQIITGIYPKNGEDSQKVYDILSEYGLNKLIITLGKSGSIVFDEKKTTIPGFKVNTVDSTGAGDAYIGALAFGLSKDETITEAAKLASQVSALCVTKNGAQTAMPTYEEVINHFSKENIK